MHSCYIVVIAIVPLIIQKLFHYCMISAQLLELGHGIDPRSLISVLAMKTLPYVRSSGCPMDRSCGTKCEARPVFEKKRETQQEIQ